MKLLYLIVAAFALVGTYGQDLNVDSTSNSLSGVEMTFEEFLALYDDTLGRGSLPESGSASNSAANSASGSSGSMGFESIEELQSYVIDATEEYLANVTKTMAEWGVPSSVELETKLDEVDALLVDINKTTGWESTEYWGSILDEIFKKVEEVVDIADDCVAKNADADAMTLDESTSMFTIASSTSTSGSRSASTEGSGDSSITQTSEDSTTQLSPSFQKTWDKLTESAPATQSKK